MSASQLHMRVNDNYGVDGGPLTGENLEHLRANYKSALYLCTDNGADSAIEGGYAAVQAAFPGHSGHFPFAAMAPPFALGSDEALPKPILAMEMYRKLENAVASLQTPTVIICRSTLRAHTVISTVEAVKNGRCADEVIAEATTKNLPFVKNEGVVAWIRTVLNALCGKNKLVFRQLFEKESSTYTYLLGDSVTKEAILVDPVLETVDRDAKLIKELGLNLTLAVNTHCHADHITGTNKLKTHFPAMKSMIAEAAGADADVKLKEGDRIVFGSRHVIALATPGHTSGCMSFVMDDCSFVMTGDALFVRGCGRTDFQQGNSKQLYQNIHTKIFRLPDSCLIYPGHDYNGHSCSSVWEERTYNPRLTKTEDAFAEFMANLNLPYPKKIDASLPANLKDGVGF